ncbi:MAG: medium chain dehydrogenase/reductase family protein [Solirubrobacteraceae bacterium]
MRAVVVTGKRGAASLELQERPDPSGEVIIDVAAAGVNFADVMATQGLYPDAPKPPCVVGYEVAGTVSSSRASRWQPGQRVMAATQFGGYASQVAVPAADVIELPERLSFEQGAAVPVNYATAWTALIGYGSLRAGERVLIHAAAGGVGIAATQIAQGAGAEVYGTSSPAKHAALGVDHAIDYTRAGWERELPQFDIVLDALGGASFRRSYGMLRPGGRLVAYGASAVISGERRDLLSAARTALRMPRFNMIRQMSESKSIIGLNLLTLWQEAGSLERWLAPLTALLDDGTIQPVVAEAFPFARAGDAHRMIVERRNVGKVVLVP